jgi:hypothetical protein
MHVELSVRGQTMVNPQSNFGPTMVKLYLVNGEVCLRPCAMQAD